MSSPLGTQGSGGCACKILGNRARGSGVFLQCGGCLCRLSSGAPVGVAVCGRDLSPGETEARLPPLPLGPRLVRRRRVWAEQLLQPLGFWQVKASLSWTCPVRPGT